MIVSDIIKISNGLKFYSNIIFLLYFYIKTTIFLEYCSILVKY